MPFDAVLFLRLLYLTEASVVLIVFAVPALRSRFLDYGPRASIASNKDGRNRQHGVFTAVFDKVAQIRVPHSWFASFYAVSVTCSLYWAPELLIKGPAFLAVSKTASVPARSMTFRQVMVVWILMLAQGSRRLYECLVVSKPSSSQMWFGHWVIGVLFYVQTSVAIWLEGVASVKSHAFSYEDLIFTGPSISTFVGVLVFILAAGLQHDCHVYLASLKTRGKPGVPTKPAYKLPEHPAFNISLTPHYFAECLIYLSLAIVAAPPGSWFNWTLISALAFVAVNLGVTAYGTKQWYEAQFGEEKVKTKARMIPLLY